jgi:hypothetical protein
MLDQLHKLTPTLRIFFPEQRRWLVRVFVLCGLPLVAGNLWEPYANALIQRYLGIRVPTEASTYTGWALLGIALLIFVANEIADRLPKPSIQNPQDVSDRQSLQHLFREIHLPSMDTFFHFGKLSATYYPALHYYYGIEGFVESSSYHIHDSHISHAVSELHRSLSKALDFGEYFRDTSNPQLYKFDHRSQTHNEAEIENAHAEFTNAIYESEAALKALCKLTKQKFPDFDFDATNAAAIQGYRAQNAETEA